MISFLVISHSKQLQNLMGNDDDENIIRLLKDHEKLKEDFVLREGL